MAVAWGLIFQIGAMFARYAKSRGDDLWFKVHRTLQIMGFIIATIGFIIAIIMVQRAGNDHFGVSFGLLYSLREK